MRGRFAVLALLAVAALPFGAAACSSPPAPVGNGGACLQTTDCQDSLFCVQQKSGAKICSADLSNIVSTEEAGAPADAAPRDGSAAEGGAVPEGGMTDSGGGQPIDAGAPPEAQAPVDGGGVSEAGD